MSRLCLSTILVCGVVASAGCAKEKDYDLPPDHSGGAMTPDAAVATNEPDDAATDAAVFGAVALTCNVRVNCDGLAYIVTRPATTTTVVDREGAKKVERAVADQVLMEVNDSNERCDAGFTTDATCDATPNALICPFGMEFEKVTACILGEHYDLSLVITDRPGAPEQCANANDRSKLYADATGGEFTVYECQMPISNVKYQVAAAPLTGDASR